MLLGTTPAKNNPPDTEVLVIHLIMQNRYAQAYEMLTAQKAVSASGLYNTALCLHWGGSYHEALNRLESIRLSPQVNNSSRLEGNREYMQIRNKQNQTSDYLQGISETYIQAFPVLASDDIIRLKTDCWLQLEDYAKVIAIATPIASKGYSDITTALNIANTSKHE